MCSGIGPDIAQPLRAQPRKKQPRRGTDPTRRQDEPEQDHQSECGKPAIFVDFIPEISGLSRRWRYEDQAGRQLGDDRKGKSRMGETCCAGVTGGVSDMKGSPYGFLFMSSQPVLPLEHHLHFCKVPLLSVTADIRVELGGVLLNDKLYGDAINPKDGLCLGHEHMLYA